MATYWTKEKDDFIKRIKKVIHPVDVVLDIGCGILPQKHIKTKTHICCEPFEGYVDHLLKKYDGKRNNIVLLNCGWREATKFFPEKSVDTVFLLDVIEHLPKAEGKMLIKKTERIARKQIVVFTPLGFISQKHPDGIDAWGLKGGKYQEHKSGWMPKDFGKGWDVYGCKKYHFVDNKSKKLDKPHGAIYAIWNSDSEEKKEKTFLSRILKPLLIQK